MPIHRDDVKTRFQLDLLSVELPPPPPPTSDTAVHFLALKSIPGVGKATLTALYDEFHPLASVWDEDRDRLVDVLRRARNRHTENIVAEIELRAGDHVSQAIEQLRRYEKARITILFRDEPNYPPQVHAAGGPPFLFVQGNPHLLYRVSTVAIVGTREPTEDGILLARQTTRLLTEAGFVIVSGLAEGIDAEVHTTVLDYGGQTIAVLGNGLDVDFPASNRDLRRRILQTGGAVVTEYLPYESYSRASFVARNRVQAALAGAVIPIQGQRKSGTAHTIRFARELGRMLLGVRRGATPPSEEDVYTVLTEVGAPIFDVDTVEGVSQLLGLLAPIATDLQPVSGDPNLALRRIYRPALAALRDLLRRRSPDEEERAWLSDMIQRLLKEEDGR